MRPLPIFFLAPALVTVLPGSWTHADEVAGRKVLAESAGASVPRACTQANCATVVAIRHGGLDESPPPVQAHGSLSRQPPFGAYNPQAPPVTQPSFLVQKHTDIWVIEVVGLDGLVQSIEQHYPALFQVGDTVIVEGGRVRAAD